jgi:hypothetical protein
VRPRTASRLLAFAALAVAAFALGSAEPAAAAPSVTLLAPSQGQTVTLQPNAYITYRWQVSWPDAPPTGPVLIEWELSSEPSFGPGHIVGENQMCPAENYACWTTYTPPRVYGPPYGRTFYWRVTFNGVRSAVGSFRVQLAPDVVRPRVRAFAGSARRGTVARAFASVGDDRGAVRYRVTLARRGRAVLVGSFPFVDAVWGSRLEFRSAKPLPRSMPTGRYQFCITAWDRAGNRARSCALYRIR